MFLTDLEIAALREFCENIAWTHKVHEKQADIELNHSKRFRYLANTLLAISASGILATIVVDEWLLKVAFALLSFGSLCVSIHRDASCFEMNYAAHIVAAKGYLRLRERTVNLLLLIEANAEIEDWQSEFNSIREAYLDICEHAPRTSKRALKEASEAIRLGEESSLLELLKVLVSVKGKCADNG